MAVILLASAVIANGGLRLAISSVGTRMDLEPLKASFDIRGPRQPPKDVVILSIDDTSFERLNASTNYPLPRKHFATALENLTKANPRVVIADLRGPPESDRDPDSDNRIAQALSQLPATLWNGEVGTTVLGKQLTSDRIFRHAAKMELSMLLFGVSDYKFLLAGNNRAAHAVTGRTISRSSALQEKERFYESFELAKPLIELGGYELTVPAVNSLINFYGSAASIPRLSISELIVGDVAAAQAQLSGKVVFIGVQSVQAGRSTMQKDEYRVPSDPGAGMFGVEIHATIACNLLDQSWLKQPKPEVSSLLLMIILLASSVALLHKPSRLRLIVVIGGNLLLHAAGYLAFALYDYFIPGLTTISLVTFGVMTLAFLYFDSRMQKFEEYLKRTFGFEIERKV